MIDTTKRCLRKVLARSQATDEELATTLVRIEAALNSKPITQDTDDGLTPAHYPCGAKLPTLPSTTEAQREGNFKKTHQRSKRMADDFWRRGEEEYFMELRSFVNQGGSQGRSKQETSSSSMRIAAADTCGRRTGWRS